MFSSKTLKNITLNFLILSMLGTALAYKADAKTGGKGKGSYGVIKGIIINDKGKPLSSALISVVRSGSTSVLKQIKSAADGSFITRILPGKYNLLATANGYTQVALNDVNVARSAEVYYGLRLEPVGNGRTFAEKKADHNSPKWRIRAAQAQRSIYQAGEGDSNVAAIENTAQENDGPVFEERIGIVSETPESQPKGGRLRGQSLAESYFANTAEGESFVGFNFATVQPLSKNTKIILAGQTGTAKSAPNRFQAGVETRLNDSHQLNLTVSGARMGTFTPSGQTVGKEIGQLSFQATDQWQVREGFILVYGFDLAQMVGAGNDTMIAPRFGVQYDLNPRTRLSASYTAATEERTWQSVAEMEGESILFREAMQAETVAEMDDAPVLQKNRRFEIGIERVLDNSSSIEATAFFDTFSGRGVGLVGVPMGFFGSPTGNQSGEDLLQTFNQTGKTQGFRVSYNRRFGSMFTANAGYSFGRGQQLSADGLNDPQSIFTDQLFQTFMAQLSADLRRGTRVKAVYRLSPQATVFAIDPFAGRMAIYDPSVSIMLVQTLPTWGLPFRAEAVLDARNLLDQAVQSQNEDGTIRLNSARRGLRGAISVRF